MRISVIKMNRKHEYDHVTIRPIFMYNHVNENIKKLPSDWMT